MPGPYSILRLIPWFLPWPTVSGKVVRYWVTRGDNGRFYHLVTRFRMKDGKVVVAISNHGSWNRPFDEGACIQLKYCPDDPQHFEVESFEHQWSLLVTLLLLILGFAGFVFFAWRFGPFP